MRRGLPTRNLKKRRTILRLMRSSYCIQLKNVNIPHLAYIYIQIWSHLILVIYSITAIWLPRTVGFAFLSSAILALRRASHLAIVAGLTLPFMHDM